MALFPPGVNIHNDNAEERSKEKLDPATKDALTQQTPVIRELLAAEKRSRPIYANVTARLDYSVGGSPSGDLDLELKDVIFIGMKITNENITAGDAKFDVPGPGKATKQVTYSILLMDPEYQKWVEGVREAEIKAFGAGRKGIGASGSGF